jgi:hypothetical protein
MDWGREGFRKAYFGEGAGWLLLPISARGLTRELLWEVDPAGRIGVQWGPKAHIELAHALGAHPGEHRRLRLDLEALRAEKEIVDVDGSMALANHEASQARAGAWRDRNYRKMYRASPGWRLLPLSARALGRELLMFVDDEGRVDLPLRGAGEEAQDALRRGLYRLLCAGRNDRLRMAHDLNALFDDKFLVIEGSVARVRNYVPAQDRVTPGAARVRRFRAERYAEEEARVRMTLLGVATPVAAPAPVAAPVV